MAYQFCWSDFRTLGVISTMEILETYLTKNNNLFEANEEDFTKYFLGLTDNSEIPKINNSYILVSLVLNNNKIITVQQPDICKILKKTKSGYFVELSDGRKAEFPNKELGDKVLLLTFYFSDNNRYDKLRTAVRMKFDDNLPDAPKIGSDEITESTNFAEELARLKALSLIK
jgi:hypothetical protein